MAVASSASFARFPSQASLSTGRRHRRQHPQATSATAKLYLPERKVHEQSKRLACALARRFTLSQMATVPLKVLSSDKQFSRATKYKKNYNWQPQVQNVRDSRSHCKKATSIINNRAAPYLNNPQVLSPKSYLISTLGPTMQNFRPLPIIRYNLAKQRRTNHRNTG